MRAKMADLRGFGGRTADGRHPFTKPLHYHCAKPANVGFPRVSAAFGQRGTRGKRGEQRFPTAQSVAHSVRGAFA
jgi:hypothetical protein